MTKKLQNYSIGLDIGTNSIGWAVIDENYNLARLNGKDAWGAYLFESAKEAKDRRVSRSIRRGYERKKERIRLLQELFSNMILPIDNGFYNRLEDSKYHVGEGDYFRTNKYNLFDGQFTDKDYYKSYKTIYHLRDALMNEDKKFDIRLVYLACHHIIKYRGHFLNEGEDFDPTKLLYSSLMDFFTLLKDGHNIDFRYDEYCDSVLDIIRDKDEYKKKQDKINTISKLLNDNNSNQSIANAIAKLMFGNTVKLQDILIFNRKYMAKVNPSELSELEKLYQTDDGKVISFSFKKFDDDEDFVISKAGEKSDIIESLKNVYSAIVLDSILCENTSISKAMIQKYDEHKNDLAKLKKLLSDNRYYEKQDYEDVFSSKIYNVKEKDSEKDKNKKSKKCYYHRYIKYPDSFDPDKKETFYTSLKKVLLKDDENVFDIDTLALYREIMNKIEQETLLPKLNSVDNSQIPYQLNKYELEKILDNQSRFYTELKNIKDKVVKILEFKRPYYVGPLKGDFSWNRDKDGNVLVIDGKVTPWNFYELVNKDLLAEKFIVNMTNKCKILRDKNALPKQSILYQSYEVLNEINTLKFKKNLLSVEQKQRIFNDLCLRKKTVKKKDIEHLLVKEYGMQIIDGDLQGLADDKLNSSMSTLIDIRQKLGQDFDIKKNLPRLEKAIYYLSIFDDKKIRIEKLKGELGFDENQTAKLAKMKCSKWGAYSKELLHGTLGSNGKSILTTMYENNVHINELIAKKDNEYGFYDKLPHDIDVITDFNYDKHIKDLYCSPSVKKAMWNVIKIIKEIEHIAKCPPKRIFIESTMEDKEKKKTDSRVSKLKELYKDILNDNYFNSECDETLKELVKNNSRLDKDKLYLWLLQLGRCMYSGEIIRFEDLPSCEIDHIVPRAYIKDDSFENRVLVKRIENQKKSDTLMLPTGTIQKMKPFWTFLNEKHFIGKKKLINLQKEEISDNEKVGFINRQLVETNQIVKAVSELLKRKYIDSEIRCIKAGMNTQFRAKFSTDANEYNEKKGFYKLREVNNLHHAKDAYLTAVLGQFTTVACPCWGQNDYNRALKYYINNNDKAKDSVKTLVNKRYGLILDLMEKDFADDEGEIIWDNQRYLNIFRNMEKNTPNIVKEKVQMAESSFYDQTIYSPKCGMKKLIPLKSKKGKEMPVEIYGGYSSEKPAYFVIVEKYKKTKKSLQKEYVFDSVPVRVVINEKKNPNAVKEYIKNNYGNDAKIIKKVYKYQEIFYKGQLLRLRGKDELGNAFEPIFDYKFDKLLYFATHNYNRNDLAEKQNRILEETDYIKEFISQYIDIVSKNEPFMSNFIEDLKIVKESIDDMSIKERKELICSMLTISDTSVTRIKINVNGKDKERGRISGITIRPNEVKWIDKSPTGLFVRIREGV